MPAIIRGWPWCEKDGELWFGGLHHMRHADSSTFEVLSKWWARDSKNVYSAGSVIRDADPESFTVLNELYAKDATRAYTMMGPIKEAHVSTFEAIGDTRHSFGPENGYAKDSHAVYHTTVGGNACLMKAGDAATFVPLGNGYGRDSKNVFYERFKLAGARVDEWEFIRGPHSRSGKKAYHFDKRIRGASGHSLKSLPILNLHYHWCRDDNGFFKRSSPADPQEYFQEFRNRFIFIGKVDHVELTCHQDNGKLSVDEPDAWMIADHAWIYVTPSRWLQKPSVTEITTPEIGKPVRFGEAMRLDLLLEGNWMNEKRIWMLRAVEESSRKRRRFFFSCADYWWQYLNLSELAFITDLIAEAKVK